MVDKFEFEMMITVIRQIFSKSNAWRLLNLSLYCFSVASSVLYYFYPYSNPFYWSFKQLNVVLKNKFNIYAKENIPQHCEKYPDFRQPVAHVHRSVTSPAFGGTQAPRRRRRRAARRPCVPVCHGSGVVHCLRDVATTFPIVNVKQTSKIAVRSSRKGIRADGAPSDPCQCRDWTGPSRRPSAPGPQI